MAPRWGSGRGTGRRAIGEDRIANINAGEATTCPRAGITRAQTERNAYLDSRGPGSSLVSLNKSRPDRREARQAQGKRGPRTDDRPCASCDRRASAASLASVGRESHGPIARRTPTDGRRGPGSGGIGRESRWMTGPIQSSSTHCGPHRHAEEFLIELQSVAGLKF